MKLYSAAADVQIHFSEKALEWYEHADMIVQKNKLGLYFYRMGTSPILGPYTLAEINKRCEHWQHILEDDDIDWYEAYESYEDDDDLDDFFIDDDLANDIDRRQSHEG